MFSYSPCGERDIPHTRRRTVGPHDLRPALFLVLVARVAFCSSKDTSSGVCTLLQPRLHRNGANGFLTETKQVLGAKPFVVEAMLWTTVAVSAVFVMYLLVRRWL